MVVPAPRKYPQELRERTMRLVQDVRQGDPGLSLNGAVVRIGQRTGVNPDTLRGVQAGPTSTPAVEPGPAGTTDAARIRKLELENRELKWANEIVFGGHLVLRAGARPAFAVPLMW